MADDGIVKIGTVVDVSGLQSGMAEARQVVQTSTDSMEMAFQKFAATTAETAVSQANLRAVLSQLVSGQIPYTLATKALTPALMEQSAATRNLQEAKAALLALEEKEPAVVRSGISARMAASSELRVLSGNFQGSTRAAGALLAMLPGVGEAIQSAFAVFGIVAFAEIAVEAGEKLYKAFDLGGQRARQTQQDIRAVNQELERSSTSLDVQIDKLQQEQAKLERIPFNGTKLVLDQAAEAAQNLADKLDQVVDREKKAIEGMSASFPQRIFGQSQTGYEQTMLSEHAKWIGEAKTQQDQLNESTSYGNSLQTRLADLKAKQAAADKAAESSSGETGIVADYSREIQAVQQMISWQEQEQSNIKKTIQLNEQEGATQQARDKRGAQTIGDSAARKAAEAERKANTIAIQADRSHLEAQKAVHAMTALEEAQYWENVALLSKSGSRRYANALDESNKSLARFQQQTSELSKRVGTELEATWQQGEAAAKKATKAQDDLAQAVSAAGEKMKAAQDAAAISLQEAGLRAGEASGRINGLAAAQMQAQLHAKAYREELERLDAELTRISTDNSPDVDPKQRQKQIGDLQAQKVQVQGQAQTTAIADKSNIQQQISQPYLQAFDQINQGWLQVQDRMFYSMQNISIAFAEMGQQIFLSIVNSMEKAVLVAAEHDLLMVINHQAANQTIVASDAQKAAEQQTLNSTSALKRMFMDDMETIHHIESNIAKVASDSWGAIQSLAIKLETGALGRIDDAKSAASSTYAVVSGWPVVGPILAPEFAAAAFVAAAAFETGTGYIPRDGMAYLHEGEAVIPAPTMSELRGSGAAGSNITVHHSTNISGVADREVIKAIRRNPGEIAGALKQHLRQMGRG